MNRRNWSLWAVMAAGYAFLYVPILSLAVYSFSASRMATVWGGFSTRWYAALFANEQIMQALGRSLAIAALSATLATVLGTASGLALSRFGRFPGRGLLSLMNSAPMVMPDVMLGLSSLLLFVTLQHALGWPERGMCTIMIAHVTLTACYVVHPTFWLKALITVASPFFTSSLTQKLRYILIIPELPLMGY